MKLFSVKYTLETEKMTYGNMTLGISNDSSPEHYIYYVILPDSEKRHYFSNKDLLFALKSAITFSCNHIKARNIISVFTEIEYPCVIISKYEFPRPINWSNNVYANYIKVQLSKEDLGNMYGIVVFSICGNSSNAWYCSDEDIFYAINKMIKFYELLLQYD